MINKILAFFLRVGLIYKVIFASTYLQKEALKRSAVFGDSEKSIVIENALSKEMSELNFVDRYTKSSGKVKIVIPGTISFEKGQDRLIRIAEIFQDISFYMIGGADVLILDDLKKKCPPNIVFWGKASSMIEAFNEINPQYSIIPSRWEEPFGLVAIESMVNSCLTISSGSGGLSGIALKTGMLTFPETDSLMKILKNLFNLPADSLRNMALSQYQKTQNHFSYKKFDFEVGYLLKTLKVGKNDFGKVTLK